NLKGAQEITRHWLELAGPTGQEQTAQSLLDVMLEAQKLVKMDEELAQVHFINPFELNTVRAFPRAAKAVWIAALYHMYRAQIEQATGHGIKNPIIHNRI